MDGSRGRGCEGGPSDVTGNLRPVKKLFFGNLETDLSHKTCE